VDIASLDLVTVEPSATVRDVIRKMAQYGIRHVPVKADGEILRYGFRSRHFWRGSKVRC
jgi:CBS domain-containing protein